MRKSLVTSRSLFQQTYLKLCNNFVLNFDTYRITLQLFPKFPWHSILLSVCKFHYPHPATELFSLAGKTKILTMILYQQIVFDAKN